MRILLAIIFIILPGCSYFQTKVAPEMAKFVDRYCAESVPEIRKEIHDTINKLVQPGTTVSITCPNDPQ